MYTVQTWDCYQSSCLILNKKVKEHAFSDYLFIFWWRQQKEQLKDNSANFQPCLCLSDLRLIMWNSTIFFLQCSLCLRDAASNLLFFLDSVTSLVPERTTNYLPLAFPLVLQARWCHVCFERGFSGSGGHKLLVIENYTILNNRNVPMQQITNFEI